MACSEKQPLVSVIMPAYNVAKYIEQAIRSVMSQTVIQWELLVLDDCSTDKTCAIVQELAAADARITLHKNEHNMGVAATRNHALGLCRGRYVAFLDSDDIWYPEKLEKQLALMETTGAQLCYCAYAMIDREGKQSHADYLVPAQISYDALLEENVIGCSTVMLSAAVAQKYRFATDYYHEDYVLWLQLLKDGVPAAGCTEVLAGWRHLDQSRSANKLRSAYKRWVIYRKYLKLPLIRSVWLLCNYALAGLKKYRKSS